MVVMDRDTNQPDMGMSESSTMDKDVIPSVSIPLCSCTYQTYISPECVKWSGPFVWWIKVTRPSAALLLTRKNKHKEEAQMLLHSHPLLK